MLCCHALDLNMKHMTSIWWKQRIKRLKRTVSNALPLFSSIGRFVHPSRSFRSRKHVNGSMHYLINTCCKIIQVQTPPSCTLKMSWCPRCWSFSAESFLARKKTHTFTDTNACMLWLTPDDYKDSSALASGQYVTLLESHGMLGAVQVDLSHSRLYRLPFFLTLVFANHSSSCAVSRIHIKLGR